MELRHIRYFLAVAAEGNFTRAAARLGIGQPPLSLQIKDLEREVGAQLFRRLPHGAELTAAGQAFLDGVDTMPTVADRAIKLAQRAARGELGALRAGFTAAAAFNPVVSDTIRTFRRAYPGVELALEEANTSRLVAGLQDGTLDVVFLRPPVAGDGKLRMHPLCEEPLVLALPADHAAVAWPEVDLASLADEAFILFPSQVGPAMHDTIIETCRRAGFSPRIEQVAPQLTSAINLVAAGMGISVVPASLTQVRVAGVEFRPIAGKAPTTVVAVACRKADTSVMVRNFMAVGGRCRGG